MSQAGLLTSARPQCPATYQLLLQGHVRVHLKLKTAQLNIQPAINQHTKKVDLGITPWSPSREADIVLRDKIWLLLLLPAAICVWTQLSLVVNLLAASKPAEAGTRAREVVYL